MTQVALVIGVLIGLAAAFYLGMRLANSKRDKKEADAIAEYEKRIAESSEKIMEMRKNFEKFKDRVRVANKSELQQLLKESLY